MFPLCCLYINRCRLSSGHKSSPCVTNKSGFPQQLTIGLIDMQFNRTSLSIQLCLRRHSSEIDMCDAREIYLFETDITSRFGRNNKTATTVTHLSCVN